MVEYYTTEECGTSEMNVILIAGRIRIEHRMLYPQEILGTD
jgi:hypothetical protein